MSHLTRLIAFGVASATLIAVLPVGGRSAGANKALRRVAGNVAYRAAQGAPLSPIAGEQVLSDDAIAITFVSSKAAVSLEDSSVVALGQNTQVALGAFNNAVAGPGSTIRLASGAMRFEIRHPQGGRANYTFKTPTATIAVRGTIGLLEAAPSGDTIVCVVCEPGDMVVTVGTNSVALVSGQVLTISPSISSSTGSVNSATTRHFQEQGLGTTAAPNDLFSSAFTEVRPILRPVEAIGAAAAAGALLNTIFNPPATPSPLPPSGLPGSIGLNGIPQAKHPPAPTPTPH